MIRAFEIGQELVSIRQSSKARATTLVLLLAACTGAPERAGPAAGIVGPVWVAEEIAGAVASGEAPITLQLGADGNASGRGGCNDYGGPYTLAGDALGFGPLAATKMACAPALMDQEQRYSDTLAQVARYAVADDRALLLMMTGQGKWIRFRRDRALGRNRGTDLSSRMGVQERLPDDNVS